MSSSEKAIGAAVRRIRKSEGLSQGAFARRLGARGLEQMHQMTVARIESGERSLRLSEALEIAAMTDHNVGIFTYEYLTSVCRRCGDNPPAGFVCGLCGQRGGDDE